MNKKIVILHTSYWDQAMGGAEIQIKYLVEFLLQENIDVHYIFEDKNIKYDTSYHPNLKLHPLKKIKLSKRFGNRWFLYKNQINQLLKQLEPDAIYTRFFSSWSGFASTYATKNNISHVWAIASDNDLKVLEKPINLIKPLDIIENSYVKKAFEKATYIIVQNNWQTVTLERKYKRAGIRLKQSAPIHKSKLNTKDNSTIRIIWIANMKPLKRPDLFLQIASNYSGFNGISFEMIGRLDANYKTQINEEENLNINFKYLGELSNDEVNLKLTKTDILINTSEYEGFSNTFIQAWMRKNIVISMNSNPDEILSKFNVGFVSPTIEEVIDRINTLKNDLNMLRKMQDEAFEYVNKEHNLDVNLNIVKNLLKIN